MAAGPRGVDTTTCLAELTARWPLRRIATDGDVPGGIAFLLSDRRADHRPYLMVQTPA